MGGFLERAGVTRKKQIRLRPEEVWTDRWPE